MNRRVFALLLTALLTVPTAYSLRAAGPVYTVEDLGTIEGLVPNITGMNAAGQLSGHVTGPSGARAVWFNNGVWNYLPGLADTFSLATGINAHGDITGYRRVFVLINNRQTAVLRAFRYVHGSAAVEAIDPLPGGTSATAFAIDDNGSVVGSGNIVGVGTRAWIATGTEAALLPNLEEMTSKACGINANGQIAGSYTSPTAGTEHAFRFDADGLVNDLSTLDGGPGTSVGCAIDGDGAVGGRSAAGTETHAFLSLGGTPLDVTPAGSAFAEVKGLANGVAVGSFQPATTEDRHAFVYTDADGTTDLNDRLASGSGWVLSDAVVVNASGQIAGQGFLNGSPAAFRLTPGGAASDTTPPSISSVTANPSSITPATKAMVTVTVSVVATDNSGETPACAVTAIDGHGAPAADSSFSGLTASVRATGGTTYTLTVTCTDASNNAATAHTDVVVPPDTTKPVFTSLTASPNTIAPPKGQFVTVTTTAVATDDSGETPVCTLSSITAAGAASADYSVTGANTGSVKAVGGRVYAFTETCTDGSSNATQQSVAVTVLADTTAPAITGIVPSPATIAPPNNLLVPVTLTVTASDDVDDAPACALTSISASGAAAGDYSITGAFSAQLRAVGGRVYRLNVDCADAAGNHAAGFTDVVVPPDAEAPVVTSLTASPGYLWPPNSKMVHVALAVQATDNLDATPQCTLTSVTGGGAGDASVTGALTASVRAEKNGDGSVRLYTFHVTCVDDTGNSSTWTTGVAVSKDPALAAAAARFKLTRTALAHWDWHATLQRLVAELRAARR